MYLINGNIYWNLTNSGLCVQAFAVIATSPLNIDLSCVLEHVIAELTAFLRKVWRMDSLFAAQLLILFIKYLIFQDCFFNVSQHLVEHSFEAALIILKIG